MFSPMEKTDPDAENTARSAFDQTVLLAEEKLDVKVAYRTYTAEDYQDKTYDDVTLERARNNMDDLYLMNPDTIQMLGTEGKLADLSDLACVENLREVVKALLTGFHPALAVRCMMPQQPLQFLPDTLLLISEYFFLRFVSYIFLSLHIFINNLF